MSSLRRDALGFRRAMGGGEPRTGPSPREAARAALDKLAAELRERDDRERRAGCPRELAELSDAALRLLGVLQRSLDGTARFDDLDVAFTASGGEPGDFAPAFAELARSGFVSVGPEMGADGQPAARGIVVLRGDVTVTPPDPA